MDSVKLSQNRGAHVRIKSFTDTVAKQNSDGLEAYETALRDAQNNYSGTDESTAISFDKFNSVIDAKE